MDVHQRLSGVLLAVMGAVGLLGALGLAVLWWSFSSDHRPLVLSYATLGYGLLAAFLLVWCLAALLGGLAAYDGDRSARRIMVPVALLALPNFPLGTFAGLYALWAWWRHDNVLKAPPWKRMRLRR